MDAPAETPRPDTPPAVPPLAAAPTPPKKSPRSATLAIACGVLAVAGMLFVRSSFRMYYIPSEAMVPTLKLNDRLLVNKMAFRGGALPERGDVVVFAAPPEATDGQENIEYIKRVVALPGDTVQVRPAAISVGGKPLDPQDLNYLNVHDYLREKLGVEDETPVKIEEGCVLVGGTERVEARDLAAKLGMAGKRVSLTPGALLVNGKAQAEPYTNEDPDYTYPSDGGTLKLGADELFVMGDNRNRSKDSHIWGPLKRDRLVGRMGTVFPASP